VASTQVNSVLILNVPGLEKREQVLHKILLILLAIYAAAIPFKAYDIVNNAALVAAVCAVFLARGSVRNARSGRTCRMMLVALAALVAASVLSVIFADSVPGIGPFMPEDTFLCGAAILFAVAFGLRDAVWVRRLLWLMLIAYGVFLLIDAACAPWHAGSWSGGRFIGLRRSPSAYSKELLQLLALYLGAAIVVRDRRGSALLGAGALVAGVLLLMTRTRFALLTAGVVTIPAALLVAMSLLSRRKKILAVCAWVLVAAPLAGYGWYVMNPGRHSLASAELRIQHWQVALEVAGEAPWHKAVVGHGHSRSVFEAVAAHYASESYGALAEQLKHAHNDLIQTFIAAGAFGVVALAAVWLMTFGGAVGTWRRDSSPERGISLAGVFVVALLTVAVMCQLDCCMRNKVQAHIAWYTAGLAFAYFRLKR
jgi:O-antigen ligase